MPVEETRITNSGLLKSERGAWQDTSGQTAVAPFDLPPKALSLPPKHGFGAQFLLRYKDWWIQRSVGPQVLSDFFDHLATLLASGIPLLQVLEFIRRATRHEKLIRSLETISEKIRTGAQFSEALLESADIFDSVAHGMVKAAEASGRLEAVSRELSRAYAQRAEVKSRFLQALAYPALVACFGVITVSVLMVFVIPQLATVFQLWETPLPLLTRMLIGTSTVLSHGGFLVLILASVSGLLFVRSLGAEKRRRIGYRVLSKIAFLRRLFFLTDLIRVSRTWAMLLRSGVPMIEAIRASREVIWNLEVRCAMDRIREKVVRGSTLQEAMLEEPWFPELAMNFLVVGEETGTLDDAFEKIATFYQREFDGKIKLLGTFLEPMMILAIGLVVGFLVISLLLPIFEMSLVVQ